MLTKPSQRLHRDADHYENMYAVLCGTKRFTLLPPCDVWRLHTQQCPAAQWVLEELQLPQGHPPSQQLPQGHPPSSPSNQIEGEGERLKQCDHNHNEGILCVEPKRLAGISAGIRSVDNAAVTPPSAGNITGGSCSDSAAEAGLDDDRRWRARLREPSETVSWCPVDPRPSELHRSSMLWRCSLFWCSMPCYHLFVS
jgi:jumonji domain-containing protein 7